MHECLRAGIEMRALAISTHHDLRKIMGRIDLQAVGYGDVGPTGSATPIEDDEAVAN
jgi:hypothetical protein